MKEWREEVSGSVRFYLFSLQLIICKVESFFFFSFLVFFLFDEFDVFKLMCKGQGLLHISFIPFVYNFVI